MTVQYSREVTIYLSEREYGRLVDLAEKDERDVERQAAWLLRKATGEREEHYRMRSLIPSLEE